MRFRFELAICFPLLLCGCLLPRTTVVSNPGPRDKGIRFYRPKPYLLVKPTRYEEEKYVTLSLEYLPDFSEEYSIRIRSGLIRELVFPPGGGFFVCRPADDLIIHELR